MIPVPLLVGLVGLLLLFFTFKKVGEEPAGPEDYPNGEEPTGVCRDVWIQMHIWPPIRWPAKGYAWNVTRTATSLGISEDQVRQCYPQRFWDEVRARKRDSALDSGEAEFGVSPSDVQYAWRELRGANPELGQEPRGTGKLATIAGLIAAGFAALDHPIPISELNGSADRWRRYVALIVGRYDA